MDFVEDDIQDVARGLPEMMKEVDTGYDFSERNFSYETGPENEENVGAISKYTVKVPEEDIPHPREDLERVFGANVTLQVWEDLSDLDMDGEVGRKVQLYTGASRTTPRDYRQQESQKLHELLTEDIDQVMTPEPDRSEHIDANGSEVYEWLE